MRKGQKIGREITFPQVCEKGELAGGGWTQAASLQQDHRDMDVLGKSDGPKAPLEQPDLGRGFQGIYQGLEKAPLLISHQLHPFLATTSGTGRDL